MLFLTFCIGSAKVGLESDAVKNPVSKRFSSVFVHVSILGNEIMSGIVVKPYSLCYKTFFLIRRI